MNANVDVPAFLTIFTIYLEAFAEHDPVRRRRLLARCLSEDSEIWGPNRMFVGISEVCDKIASFHDNWPNCRLVLATGLSTFDNVVRLGNAFVGPDGSVRARGETIFALASDGRIRSVVPLWEAELPPLPKSWQAHLGVPGTIDGH